MTQIDELIQLLNGELEIKSIEDYCPNGLQVERTSKEVSKVATAVSASLETIEQAIEHNVQVLVVHHGIFWKRDPYPLSGIKKVKIEKLIKADMALLAYHLPLDCHRELGNNWKAAQDLGWDNLQGFGPHCGDEKIGVMGTIAPTDFTTFQNQLESYYQHKAHVAAGGPKQIQKVALISGGAYKELDRAADQGVDAFVTGSFDEPAWHVAHERNIHFFALGHSNTETVGPKALANFIRQKLSLDCQFIDIENPF